MSAPVKVIHCDYELTTAQRQRLVAAWKAHGYTAVILSPSDRALNAVERQEMRDAWKRKQARPNRDKLWAALSLAPSLAMAYWFYGVKFTQRHGAEYWPLSWFFILLWLGLAFSIWRAVSRPPRSDAQPMSRAWWFVLGPLLALATFCSIVMVVTA